MLVMEGRGEKEVSTTVILKNRVERGHWFSFLCLDILNHQDVDVAEEVSARCVGSL